MSAASASLQRRTRSEAAIPLLRHGFRPFFLGAACWAAVAMPLWLASFVTGTTIPSAMTPLGWHMHEMVFGYAGAVVIGFMLTAVPNWTGCLPVRGWPLAALVTAWALARIANLTSGVIGPWPAMLLDVGALAAGAGLAMREVIHGRNWRNLPVVGVIGLLVLAALCSHLGEMYPAMLQPGIGPRLGIAILCVLIALVGGRIVPSFTTNWLKKAGSPAMPAPFGTYDKVAILALAAAVVTWLVAAGSWAAFALLLLAGALHVVRLARWQPQRTWPEPLLLILHIGYGWLAFGLLALALAQRAILWDESAALHALTAGAIATMTLAVMTRATLGHTGRELTAGPGTTAIYMLVGTGAVLRLVMPLLPFDYGHSMAVAGLFWAAAYLLFVVVYGPMLLRARVDGKGG